MILFCSPVRSAYIICVFYHLSCGLLQNIICISMWMSPNKESLIIIKQATWFVYESLLWLVSAGNDDIWWFVAGEANLAGDPWGLNPGLKVAMWFWLGADGGPTLATPPNEARSLLFRVNNLLNIKHIRTWQYQKLFIPMDLRAKVCSSISLHKNSWYKIKRVNRQM